jgi:hypothetical protein
LLKLDLIHELFFLLFSVFFLELFKFLPLFLLFLEQFSLGFFGLRCSLGPFLGLFGSFLLLFKFGLL